MVTMGILPFKENSHGRAGNRTRDLMISRQRLTTRLQGWPFVNNYYEGIINLLAPELFF